MPWITERRGLYKFLPTLTIQCNKQIKKTLELLPINAKICDIGAGGRKITKNTFTVDKIKTINTDLVCDVHEIDLPDESFDCIFCTGVLEHVDDPDKVTNEIWRLLKPSGIVHIEVPFIQGYHPDPYDYRRWTLEGIKLFCRKHKFQEIRSGVSTGPTSALNWVLNGWLISIFGKGLIGNIVDILSRFILFPFKNLDYFIPERKSFYVACAVYFVGKKD